MTLVPTAQMGFIKVRCQSAVAQPISPRAAATIMALCSALQVTGSPYATGANMNADSGVTCDYPITGGTGVCASNTNQLGRIEIAVAPSNPNVLYAQVQSIAWNNNAGCGNTNGCQLGVWSSTDGGDSWTFMAGSAGRFAQELRRRKHLRQPRRLPSELVQPGHGGRSK